MKKVLITGGNKGIGQAITKKFLDNNCKVFVIARDFSEFTLQNPNLEKNEFDLSQIQNIPSLVGKIGDIDVLINNAGLMNSLPFDNYPDEKVEQIISVNIKAPVALIKEFSKSMVTKNQGRIINVASIAGEIGHPDIWYGITKAGIINMTKSFAKILGIYGITVNCVAPGPVEGTPMFKIIPQIRKDQIKSSVISGRFAKPEEIAETIYWLSTDAPKYINGICIDINNGAFMR